MIVTPGLVIFMLIVFVVLFLFINTIDKRKWLTFIISAVLTPLVYFYIFYPFINIISNYHHQKYYSSEAWLNKPALRYEMVDNMLTTDTLIGLTKKQLEQHLGPFEWLSWDEAKKAHDSTKWNYNLGIEPGAFNKNKECIEVIFINDRVSKLRAFQEKISYEKSEE